VLVYLLGEKYDENKRYSAGKNKVEGKVAVTNDFRTLLQLARKD